MKITCVSYVAEYELRKVSDIKETICRRREVEQKTSVRIQDKAMTFFTYQWRICHRRVVDAVFPRIIPCSKSYVSTLFLTLHS